MWPCGEAQRDLERWLSHGFSTFRKRPMPPLTQRVGWLHNKRISLVPSFPSLPNSPPTPLHICAQTLSPHMGGCSKKTPARYCSHAVGLPNLQNCESYRFLIIKYIPVCGYSNRKKTKTHSQRTSDDDGEASYLCCPAQWPLAVCAPEHQKCELQIVFC